MNSVSQGIGHRLVSTRETGLDPVLLVPLLRLLAAGEPVGLGDLALESGRTVDQIRQALAATPETEYDDQGRIIGLGLTLRPTRSRFTVNGEQLYTWCALDTLIFPILLPSTATIESSSPTGGRTIRVTAAPKGVTAVEPASSVVSLVNPDDLSSIRSSFCNQVHYFASAEDAQPWLADHLAGEVLPVNDAYRLALDLATTMLERCAASTATGSAAGTIGPTEATDEGQRCC